MQVKIERCLKQSGEIPFFLSKGDRRHFKTLKELKEFFGITKVEKIGKSWAINSRGTKVEWVEYIAEMPDEGK